MKRYLDTSVWIASFITSHPKHQLCLELISKSFKKNIELVASTHCLAEVYSVLTKLPAPLKYHPKQAVLILKTNIVAKVKIVGLTPTDYMRIIQQSSELNLVSGAIFDGLHVQAAIKSKVDEIITLNGKDFSRFKIPSNISLVEF